MTSVRVFFSRFVSRLFSSAALLGVGSLLLAAGFTAAPARAQYTAPIDIPLPQSTAVVSKNGTVAGSGLQGTGNQQNQCLFIWTPQNGATVFNCEHAYYGIINSYIVLGVNNSGTILGLDANNEGVYFTATASGGEVQLQLPGGGNPSTEPYSGDQISVNSMTPVAIDDNGNVVGYSNVYDSTSQTTYNEAVLWPAGSGTPVYLGPFQPIAINDAGQVMGPDSNGNGWVWTQANGPVNIGNLTPTSQNSSGQITGTLPNGDIFLWSSGTGAADLGPNPAIPTPLLNDGGVIVGSFPISIFNLSGVQAESWTSNNGFQQMQSLDGAGPGGLNIDTPAAINAVSQVVGQGYFYNGGQQAEYWANLTAQPLALGAGQINAISDNGWAVGVDYMTGYAAVWPLNGQVIGASGAPTINIQYPTNNTTLDVGAQAPVFYSCNSPDGISSCSAQDSLGNTYPPGSPEGFSNLDTNVAGNFTLTYTAVSGAGVTTTQTVNYSIVSSATQITGAKMRGYGALATDQLGDLYRFTMNVEDTQNGTQAGRFDLWSVDKNGFPRVAAIFDADSITSVNFTNTGLLGTNKKGQLLADTVTFQGTGEYNDQPGYTITVTATDAGNPGVGVDSMNIAVTDPNNNPVFTASGLLDAGNIFSTRLGKTPPPVFTDGPPPVTQLEATGPNGAVATFDAPVAVDYNGNQVPASCTLTSGSTFPLGVTHGTCTATDANGRSSAIRFRVNVRDTTPPVISNLPLANITVSATMPSGAVVTYPLPTATDTVDPNPTVTCTKASGATFAITITTVVCTAKDASGNKSQATFTVTVNDTTPPVVTPPANITAEATSSAGAVVKYKTTVADAADNNPAVACSQASGTTFPLGVTTVSCSATDKWGVSSLAAATFTVTVQDTTAPKIANQATITAEATSAAGAVVTYTPPTWTDAVSGTGSANCLPASGSTFAIGTTTVSCSATDGAGNTSTSTFKVKVTDNTPITFSNVPTSIYYQTNRSSAPVTYIMPTVTDILTTSVTETCSPASGSSFPQGSTTVTCTAKDTLGNKASVTFQIIVTIPD